MEYVNLGDLIVAAKNNRCGDCDFPVLSITKNDGIVLQSEKFKKRIASKDTANYKIVHRGQLVQGIHIDEANFGIQEVVDIGIVSPAYKIWDIKRNAIVPKYLEVVLRSPRSIAYYASKFNGSIKRRERLSDKDFLQMRIPCPSVDEQIYAIEVLDKIIALIDSRKQQLLELDNLIKARFIELFGDPLRPTHSNLLGDIAVLERGRFSPRPRNDPRYYGGDYPFIQTGDIANCGHRLSTYRQTLNERGIHVSKKFTRGTIVIAIVGATIGATAILEIDVYAPDSVIGINVDEKLYNNVFLETLLQFWQPELLRIAPESARANINLSILQNIPIVDVGLELQEQFAAFVEQTDKSKVVGLINGIMNGGVSSDSRPDGIETCPSEKCTK